MRVLNSSLGLSLGFYQVNEIRSHGYRDLKSSKSPTKAFNIYALAFEAPTLALLTYRSIMIKFTIVMSVLIVWIVCNMCLCIVRSWYFLIPELLGY